MVQIYNNEIEDLLNSLPQKKPIPAKAAEILERLCQKHGVRLSKREYNNKKRAITREIEDLKKLIKNKKDVNIWREKLCILLETPTSSPESQVRYSLKEDKPAMGRPVKKLKDNPQPKTFLKIVDSVLDVIEDHAEKQGVSASYLLDELCKRGKKKFKTDETSKSEILSVQEATSLIYNLDLSVNKYQELRLELLPKLQLPTHNDVDKYKASLIPPDIESDQNKTSCDVESVIKNTVNSILSFPQDPAIDDLKFVHVEGKFGLDGSGSHNYRHQFYN